MKAVSFPEIVEGGNPSYWLFRLRFHPDAVTCDKTVFCSALAAEGLTVNPSYNHMPHTSDWFKNKHVFGTSQLPWSSPFYRGDPNREFVCPNAVAAIRDHFVVQMYESWGRREADDVIAVFEKLENAFAQ